MQSYGLLKKNDTENLYWSYQNGWVSKEQADHFDAEEMRRLTLPDGSCWVWVSEL